MAQLHGRDIGRGEVGPYGRDLAVAVEHHGVDGRKTHSAIAGRESNHELKRSFAPKPDMSLRVKEKKKTKERKADKAMSGFVEFCCYSLGKNHPDWSLAEVRTGMLEYFDNLEEMEKIRRLGKKLPKNWLPNGRG